MRLDFKLFYPARITHAQGMSQPAYDYDLAVLGGGSAGYAAARTAVANGFRTTIVEGGEELGGLCILRGCMPTKALLYAAEVLHLAHHGETWGLQIPKPTFDFAKVMARKNAMIADFASYRRQQLESGKFSLIRGLARFTDPHTVEVSNGQRLTARHFLIATGSTIAPYPLPKLGDLDCLTSDTALKLECLPESILVLGGGAVAVEFAQFFVRFGVKVTLIQRSEHILTGVDSDVAAEVEKALRREGIELYTGTKLLDAERTANSRKILFRQGDRVHQVEAEAVFYGLGRTPNIASLNLEAAGVQVEYQRIVTDARMQTTAPHIYAAGDCTGLHEIVHIAIQQGETAALNMIHPDQPRLMDYRLLTEVVFTDPQVATVGLTEKRAKARNIPYVTAQYPFNDHGKSLIMDVKEGFVKLLADPKSGEILGGACVGPSGGELIHEIVAAMHQQMTVRELAGMPHYHPTLAEIWTYPAEELADQIQETE
jgi:pyruvate/2-oxoglutarate dehydrogenase complex dihydrolipoamide dehydrogenase (E3) component